MPYAEVSSPLIRSLPGAAFCFADFSLPPRPEEQQKQAAAKTLPTTRCIVCTHAPCFSFRLNQSVAVMVVVVLQHCFGMYADITELEESSC